MREIMAVSSRKVIICGAVAGTAWLDEHGRCHFRYDDTYAGTPLSISMPVSNRTFGQAYIRPYLFGLLPDSESQRKALAGEFEVRPNNPIALLAHIGRDCPGAVQLCSETEVEATLSRTGTYLPLSDHEIALRLKAIRDSDEPTWVGRNESWSLGGNQGKFALAWHEGRWCSAEGAVPTTHIFKNGVIGFKLQTLNEYICMRTAERSDVPAAHVDYALFESEAALVVKRYDRIVLDDGSVRRLHQEDFCQALGCMPSEKHTSDGGPAVADAISLLSKTGANAEYNMLQFTRMLFFNCLIGAPDAHAKNYSLLIGVQGDALLAPLYDAASGLAYDQLRRRGRLAMSIGDENRFGRVGRGAVERYASATRVSDRGLSDETCLSIMAELAESVPTCMEGAFDEAEAARIEGAAELREHLLPHVAENCRRTLALLD